MTGRAIMEAVYRQARAVLDKAAAATNKDQKTAQISLLVELCAYRGDSALVAEVVEGVAGYAADRSAKVRKAVVEFVDAVVARGKLQVTDECASTALATCCVLAVDENEPVAAAAEGLAREPAGEHVVRRHERLAHVRDVPAADQRRCPPR